MKNFLTVLFFTAACLTVPAAEIVKNGKAAADIAIPEKPLQAVKFAAEELQKHVKLITGVQLAITSKDSPRKYANRIHVGYGVKPTDKGNQAWRIKAEKNDIYICGNDIPVAAKLLKNPEAVARSWRCGSAGTLLGTYDFLDRELGVRWLYPGDNGIYFTPTKNITVKPFDRDTAPHLKWGATVAMPHYKYAKQWNNRKFGALFAWENQVWSLRHKFVIRKWYHTGHAFKDWWKRYGKKHPEYFALLHDGTRRPLVGDRKGQYITMCVSSDALMKQIVENYKNGYGPMGKFKERDIICLNENDSPGMCTCSNCRAWDMPEFDPSGAPYWRNKLVPTTKTRGPAFAFDDGGPDAYANTSLSDRYAKFWLRTHKELSRINPDVTVAGYAYANTTLPPRHVKLHKNILVGYVGTPRYPLTAERMAKTAAEWDGWAKTGCLMYFRPNSTWAGSAYPLQYWKPLAKEYHRILQSPLMVKAHFDTFRGEYANQGPLWYVLARLTDNPQMTVEQIADEYFNAFGRPGKYIREYFDFWEKISNTVTEKDIEALSKKLGWRIYTWNNWDICVELFKPEHFAEAKKILDKAAKAAVTPKEKQSVKFFRLGLEHARLTEIAGEAHFKRALNFNAENQKDFEKKYSELLAFRRKHERSWISSMPQTTNRELNGFYRSIPENSGLREFLKNESKKNKSKADPKVNRKKAGKKGK